MDTAAAPTARTAPPWWRDPWRWARAALTYGVAAVSGAVAAWLGVPLPWMLGPFFVCGALSACGAPLVFVPMGREFAQLAVGLGVGLRFTPATLAATVALLPAMLAATLFVIAYTFVAALILKPLAKVSDTTAFFATAAGGVADMALVARERGGDPAPVAIVHALRVSATVAIVPILVVSFGTEGAVTALPPADLDSLLFLALALVASWGVVELLKRTPVIPNPWLVGPMFLGIALGASGLLHLAVPPILLVVAQIALGTWLGCRFRRDILASIPRVAAAGVAVRCSWSPAPGRARSRCRW